MEEKDPSIAEFLSPLAAENARLNARMTVAVRPHRSPGSIKTPSG
jgi:hypothetical protein